MNTYISKDAGVNWTLLARSSYKFSMDNTGSLLIMAKNSGATNELMYSWNMGDTWTRCAFLSGFTVDYIIPVPTSTRFIILGRRGTKEVALTVNFDGQPIRSCTGFDYPNDFQSDFEYFSPPECINGRSLYYVRRKTSSACLPPPDADTGIQYVTGNCPCTQNDYQCDYCFSWNDNRQCVLDKDECPNYDPTKKPTDCRGNWYEPSGYRLVPGDTCIASEGVQHPPIKHDC